MKQTDTPTLIKAMRILARDIQSGDGVANAAIAEAADRLEELSAQVSGATIINHERQAELLRWRAMVAEFMSISGKVVESNDLPKHAPAFQELFDKNQDLIKSALGVDE